jgi:hypothetical protein
MLLMTHFLDGEVARLYHAMRRDLAGLCDVVMLYNAEHRAPNPLYTEDIELFTFAGTEVAALGYPAKGRTLNARDVELFPLVFRKARPHYKHYWVVEYDVRFTGSWAKLLLAFKDSGADLLGTTLSRYDSNPRWENWRGIVSPEGKMDPRKLLRGFFPIYRLSDHACVAMDRAYRKGWSGHFECVMPSVIARSGLILEDMGGTGEFVRPGNENRFYFNTPASNDLAPGSFVFRPVALRAGTTPDMLYHPVKPNQAGGWETSRSHTLSRRAVAWARERVGPLIARPAGRPGGRQPDRAP